MEHETNDYAMDGDVVAFAVERAYRRGYQQGAHAVMVAMQNYDESDVSRWVGIWICDWRFSLPRKLRRDGTVVATTPPRMRRPFCKPEKKG